MSDNKPTYSKQVIEIADYIFANPDKKVSDIVSVFFGKFRKTTRTIETYIAKAKEYNKSRLQKQEKIKNEVLEEETKESLKKAIIVRDEALEILTSIAKGTARAVKNEIVMPSDSERVKAIQQISKMQGWEAPIKADVTSTVIRIEYE